MIQRKVGKISLIRGTQLSQESFEAILVKRVWLDDVDIQVGYQGRTTPIDSLVTRPDVQYVRHLPGFGPPVLPFLTDFV